MPAVMSREQVVETIIRLAAEQAGVTVAEVSIDSHLFRDLNFDSLDAVDFVMQIEDEFDVSVSDEDAQHVETVRQAVEMLMPLIDKGSTAEA